MRGANNLFILLFLIFLLIVTQPTHGKGGRGGGGRGGGSRGSSSRGSSSRGSSNTHKTSQTSNTQRNTDYSSTRNERPSQPVKPSAPEAPKVVPSAPKAPEAPSAPKAPQSSNPSNTNPGNPPAYSPGSVNPPAYSPGSINPPAYGAGNPPPPGFKAGNVAQGNPPPPGFKAGNTAQGNPPPYGAGNAQPPYGTNAGGGMPQAPPPYGTHAGAPPPYGVNAGSAGTYGRQPNQPQYGANQPQYGANQPQYGAYPRQPGMSYPAGGVGGGNYYGAQQGGGFPGGGFQGGYGYQSQQKKGLVGSLFSMGGNKNRGYGGSSGFGGGGFGRNSYGGSRISPMSMLLPALILHQATSGLRHSSYHGYGGGYYGGGGGYYGGGYRRSGYDEDGDGHNRCRSPREPVNGSLKCHQSLEGMICEATCPDGFTFPDNSTTINAQCWGFSGRWNPTKYFPQCVATCKTECQNGGTCKSPNVCRCEPEFRGDLCQYRVMECDIRKLARGSKITWVCSHSRQDTSCVVDCKPPKKFQTPPAEGYHCHINGTWMPNSIPLCIEDGENVPDVTGSTLLTNGTTS